MDFLLDCCSVFMLALVLLRLSTLLTFPETSGTTPGWILMVYLPTLANSSHLPFHLPVCFGLLPPQNWCHLVCFPTLCNSILDQMHRIGLTKAHTIVHIYYTSAQLIIEWITLTKSYDQNDSGNYSLHWSMDPVLQIKSENAQTIDPENQQWC